MSKKQKIFWFLVVLPEVVANLYSRIFEYSGNWLEDYKLYFIVGFSLISILSSSWLILVSFKEKNFIWLIFSSIVLIGLIIYLYLGLAIVNMNIL